MRSGDEEADQGRFRLGRKDRRGDEGDCEQTAENGEVIHRDDDGLSC